MGFFRALWIWITGRRVEEEGEADTPPPLVALADLATPAPSEENTPEDNNFPAFRVTAMDRTAQRAPALADARFALNEAFTPAQPVTERRRFAGRLEVLVRLISALEDQRAHVVLYGERGIGKTSLVHVLAEIARQSRYHVAYASCSSSARFDEVFREALRDIPMLYARSVDPAAQHLAAGASLADLLPEGAFDARQLGDVCAMVTGTRVLIILDEYDRTQDAGFRRQVADLVKTLSDRAARVQLVIAGVAGNLQELIGYIPSIRRNIIGLPVPRLDRREVEALIAIGEREAGMDYATEAVTAVDHLCHGSPYLARLLCHHAGIVAINDGRLEVGRNDLRLALDIIVEDAQNRLGPKALAQVPPLMTTGTPDILAAIALAAATPDGSFSPADVLAALPADQRPDPAEPVVASELARIEQLGLIERVEGDTGRVRFIDETLPFFLWMALARARFPDGADRDAALCAA